MKILIAGLGSIGRRHLNNIKTLFPDCEIIALRHSQTNQSESIPGLNYNVYTLSEAIEFKPDIAFLTNPSPFHIPIAKGLAEEGIHLFIEKPLSDDLIGIYDFFQVCKSKRIKVMVGYNLRFRKSLTALKKTLRSGLIGTIISYRVEVGQYLPDWRIETDYRNSVSAKRALGGGALLELSHEIDYTRWLLGDFDTVSALTGKYSNLEIDVEDVAEINFKTKSGVLGNIHLDMVNRSKTRTCQIVGSKGTVYLDLISESLKLCNANDSSFSYLLSPQNIDANRVYLDEVSHFFDCIKNNNEPAVSIEDGIAVMEIIDAIRRSSNEQRCIRL